MRSFIAATVLLMGFGQAYDDGENVAPDSPSAGTHRTLFPTDVPGRQFLQFAADGFGDTRVCGVVYRKGDRVTNGMPLGGIDTGCIDLETSGMLGYCTIFNTHVPRRRPMNAPILGLNVGGKTWVLCDPQPPAR